MKKNLQLIELQYFGNVNYYFNLINATHIYFFNEKRYQKGIGCNRTLILGANNILTLSVPLQGGRSVNALISQVRIASGIDWQRIHWRSIHDSYRKAPWFEEYAPTLQELYTQNNIFLWEWNLACTKWALKALGINADIMSFSESEYPSSHISSIVVGDAQQCVSTKTTFNPQPLTPNLQTLTFNLQPSTDFPPYHQVFSDRYGGFVANLSILDLIMNEGPASLEYLQRLQ